MFSRERWERTRNKEEKIFQKRKIKDMDRRKQVIRMTEEPVLPALCKSLYYCMLLFSAIAFLAALIHGFQNRMASSGQETVGNALLSFGLVWIFFTVLLVLCCAIQLFRIKHGYQEKEYFFEGELEEEEKEGCMPVFGENTVPDRELQLYSRPADYGWRYKKYMKTAVIGAVICGVMLLWL